MTWTTEKLTDGALGELILVHRLATCGFLVSATIASADDARRQSTIHRLWRLPENPRGIPRPLPSLSLSVGPPASNRAADRSSTLDARSHRDTCMLLMRGKQRRRVAEQGNWATEGLQPPRVHGYTAAASQQPPAQVHSRCATWHTEECRGGACSVAGHSRWLSCESRGDACTCMQACRVCKRVCTSAFAVGP